MIDVSNAEFSVGQVVRHKLFGYHGVVYDVDPVFALDPEWYEVMARSRPPKDKPWYHVLVDGHSHSTYVAERNLEVAESQRTIVHPALSTYFVTRRNGVYETRRGFN